jgi:STAS domain-containing protein
MFDMALAADTYHAAQLDTVARHQQAIRELSTPVIRLHDRLLLMPIVGTVDSHRAEQVMETLLVRVVEDQARVVILDIAGVALVDTQVADHLLKTTAAVRLLGAPHRARRRRGSGDHRGAMRGRASSIRQRPSAMRWAPSASGKRGWASVSVPSGVWQTNWTWTCGSAKARASGHAS